MEAPTSPTDRLYRIVEDGMCIGCGLCQAVAGPDKVRVREVENGCERPVVIGDLDHGTVDQIYDVCPGARLEGLPWRLEDENTQTDLVWGPYQRMVRAYAADPEVRWKGATGGVLTALGQFLVESGEVAFILHAKPHSTTPTFGERSISKDKTEVLAGAGSRYGPTAPLIDVTDMLAREEPFAFVGKPCDIAALRNFARHDARVDRFVKHWLTPVCGGFMPPAGMKRFLWDKEGVDPASVTEFRYRGHGCPGPTRYVTNDGRAHELRYTDFWGTDESQWTLPFRCKICPDGIGEAADIAAADSWPGGSPDPETEDQDPGVNAVVIRTAAGLRLMRRAEEAGHIAIERDVDPRYMDEVQPHQVRKKHAVRARWDGLRDEGRIVPRSARLRLEALREELGPEEAARQRAGTRRRARAGKTSEPRPNTPRPTSPKTPPIRFFASLQNPYCYFALDRIEALDALTGAVELRIVAPGVVRSPNLFKGRPSQEQSYFLSDVARTAAFLGLPYAEARPYPVEMKPGALYEAAELQPRLDALHDLLHASEKAGEQLRVYSELMRLIWSGENPGWDRPETLADLAQRHGLAMPSAEAAPDPRRDHRAETEAWLAANHAMLLKYGHWRAPCFEFNREIFYGQDRLEQLNWRVREAMETADS